MKIRTGLAIGSVALLSSASAWAHNDVEFAVQGGYGFSSAVPTTLDGTDGKMSVDAAPVYGALVGYRIEKDGFIYLSYSRQQSTASFRPTGQVDVTGSRGIAFDYFQFGGYLESWRGPLAPFLGLSIGATRLEALGAPGNDVYFSAVVEAGIKYEIVKWLHLRLTGRLPFTFVSGESNVYCISGAACIGTLGGDPLIQGQALLGVGVGF